jgi:hypothetical protein
MVLELVVFALVILVPAPAGYGLARVRPGSVPWKNGLLSALPALLPFLGFAGWLSFFGQTEGETAILAAIALWVLGVIAFVTGMGLGLLGDAWARSRARGVK